MKLGLILECANKGPDEKVLKCLLSNFKPEITVRSRAQGNKINLVRDCGTSTRLLFEEDNCDRVVIVWDLYPAEWGDESKQKHRTPCLREDRQRIHAALEAADVDVRRVFLVAIEYMLESWLLADKKALAQFLTDSMPSKTITKQQARLREQANSKTPKDALSKLFEQRGYSAYKDFDHAHRIAEKISDLDALKKNPTFQRFWEKATAPLQEPE